MVSKKSRSFKEIADGLMQQIEFINNMGILDRSYEDEKLMVQL
jgi:uncharacterized protein YozE (UPF0346 family)